MTHESPVPPPNAGGEPAAQPFAAPGQDASTSSGQPYGTPAYGASAPGYGVPPGQATPGYGASVPGYGVQPGQAAPGYGAYGYGASLPGYGIPPGQAPTAPPRRRRTGLIVGLVVGVLLLCGGVVTTGALVIRSSAERLAAVQAAAEPSVEPSPRPLVAGDCIRPTSKVDGVKATSCQDAARTAKVLQTFPGTVADEQNCDPTSDDILVENGIVTCIRFERGAHPADKGQGGGVLIAGDCAVEEYGGSYSEVKCAKKVHDGQVIARVAEVAQCGGAAVRFAKLKSKVKPVLCLATGPAVAGPGQCVHGDDEYIYFAAVPCGDAEATNKVLVRRPSENGCPAATDTTVNDRFGLPRTKVMCLQDLPGKSKPKAKGPAA